MTFTMNLPRVEAGTPFFIAAGSRPAAIGTCCADLSLAAQHRIHAGTLLTEGPTGTSIRITGATYLPQAEGEHAIFGYWAMADKQISAGKYTLSAEQKGLSLAWITLSDKGAAGEREDQSGPLIESLCREHLPIAHAQGYMIPDVAHDLKGLLNNLALIQYSDLIITTGGTGVGPRDITPEVMLSVLERRLTGFEQAMMTASLQKTHNAVISRAMAGTLGGALIINLPGSKKAVAENLEAVLPAIEHTIAKLQGDKADCGS